MKISVIGAGAWGTTIAELLGEKGFDVALWIHSKKTLNAIQEWNENIYYLKRVKLHSIAKYTIDINEALSNAEIIVLTVPAQKLRSVISDVSPSDAPIVVNLAKGIEINSGKRMSQVIHEIWTGIPSKNITSLSGPNFSFEIARKMPAATVIGGEDEAILKGLQDVFLTDSFRVYYTTDLLGVELGGSVKNVLAVGAGISDGLGFGDSSKSSLVVRGVSELIRFGVVLGGKKETFYGLSGMGDLIATSFSKLSRNRWAGEEIGKGKSKEGIEESTNQVVEGLYTVKSVYSLKEKLNIDMPITTAIYNIVYQHKPPKEELQKLMRRPTKKES
ncbi:MAG: NAD(P)H-dependent glycerol-3-phosphate dehydrogenase [Caldisericota bacterium]|nr:NAD(P)H-dependent glycerol-3-phosphate dehydrogenase [Caldisericota bacterium]